MRAIGGIRMSTFPGTNVPAIVYPLGGVVA